MEIKIKIKPIAGDWLQALLKPEPDAIRAAISDALMYVDAVMAERVRQVLEEGYTPERDDGYTGGELALAAACYAAASAGADRLYRGQTVEKGTALGRPRHVMKVLWPWGGKDPGRRTHSRRRHLEIAGALIVAELQRLDRAEAKAKGAT